MLLNPPFRTITDGFTNEYSALLDGAGDYFSFTPAGTLGDGKTLAFNAWVKVPTGNHRILCTANDVIEIFNSTVRVIFSGGTYIAATTNDITRDAWVQLTVIVDTADATSTNRVKVWFDDVQETLTGSIPPQDYIMSNFDTAVVHQLGRYATGGADDYEGGLDETCLDFSGTFTTPSDFGTTTAPADISSSNPDHWLRFEGGPATFDPNNSNMSSGLSNGNLTASGLYGVTVGGVLDNNKVQYWEYTLDGVSATNGFAALGIGDDDFDTLDAGPNSGITGGWYYYTNNGNKVVDGASSVSYGSAAVVNDVIGVLTTGNGNGTWDVEFYINNVSQGVAFSSITPSNGSFRPIYANGGSAADITTIITDSEDWTYTPVGAEEVTGASLGTNSEGIWTVNGNPTQSTDVPS